MKNRTQSSNIRVYCFTGQPRSTPTRVTAPLTQKHTAITMHLYFSVSVFENQKTAQISRSHSSQMRLPWNSRQETRYLLLKGILLLWVTSHSVKIHQLLKTFINLHPNQHQLPSSLSHTTAFCYSHIFGRNENHSHWQDCMSGNGLSERTNSFATIGNS